MTMAHLPPKKLPVQNPFGQSKTLFMTASDRHAVLVTGDGVKMRRRTIEFQDAHHALDWCLKRRAGFVLSPGSVAAVALN